MFSSCPSNVVSVSGQQEVRNNPAPQRLDFLKRFILIPRARQIHPKENELRSKLSESFYTSEYRPDCIIWPS